MEEPLTGSVGCKTVLQCIIIIIIMCVLLDVFSYSTQSFCHECNTLSQVPYTHPNVVVSHNPPSYIP
jgi:hypothetical protein